MRWSWQTPGRLRIFVLSFLFIEAFFLVDASSGEAEPLPVRRIEKQAARQQGQATDPRTKGVAVSPSTPRPTISKTGIAPQIVSLAESLDRSPSRIFRFVHDSIDFDPKWGAPLGTLRERTGTSWDQALPKLKHFATSRTGFGVTVALFVTDFDLEEMLDPALTEPETNLGLLTDSIVTASQSSQAIPTQLGNAPLSKQSKAKSLKNRCLAGSVDSGKAGPLSGQPCCVIEIELHVFDVLEVVNLDPLNHERGR